MQNGNYIIVKIGNNHIKTLVDTGCVQSIINDKLAKKLKLSLRTLKSDDSSVLFSANFSKINVIATTELLLNIGGYTIAHKVKVVENIAFDLILGVDFLKENQVVIDFQAGIMSISDDLLRVPLRSLRKRRDCVFAIESTYIPAYSEAIISVRCPTFFNNKTIFLEPLPTFQFRTFAVAKAICKCENGKTLCQILNYNATPCVLRRGTRIAKIETLDSVASVSPYTEDLQSSKNYNKESETTLEKFQTEYGFKINPDLTKEQRYDLLYLLYRYKDIFAKSLKEIKQYKGYELKIDMLSNRKSFRRQYRLHPDDAEEAERQIKEMHEAGVIEETENADYNSPIFLVAKKTGEKRLVIDLRGINALITPKLVQLPKITELIDDINACKPRYYSLTDLRSGYFQIKIHENSRPYTSFTSPSGLRYQFKVCPFGLSVSPSAMLKVLLNIFARKMDYPRSFLYMDDALTVANTFEEHLFNLEKMFQNLQKNDLSCNPTKCEFGFTSIEYLGYQISTDGIKISQKKIEAIKKIQPPKNVKSLQRVFGLTTFWRRFIPDYAKNTFHMRQLLLKNTQFKWTDECQRELEYLKECLISEPVLVPFDVNRDIIIMADGSSYGFGFCILQYGDDNKLHVVSYGARATSKAQAKYTASELELTSLALALRQYECLVIHKKVWVYTDNAHLLHLDKWNAVNGRQKRLLAYLMQFNLNLNFVKGCKNYSADALSRIFQDLPEDDRVKLVPKQTQDEFVLSVTNNGDDDRSTDQTDEQMTLDVAESKSDTLDDKQTDHLITLPTINEQDYLTDDEFKDIYNYLKYDELTGNNKIDRFTLLLADQYLIEDETLYKLPIPHRKKQTSVKPPTQKLCVPKNFRHELLKFYHDNLGHFGIQRLYLTLSQKVYWKHLYGDIKEFCTTCHVCLRSKRNYSHKTVPLHPLSVPSGPYEFWSLDHKNLTRKTSSGNVAVLIIVCQFSSWTILKAVPDLTAYTTAKVFFENVVTVFGQPLGIMTDNGPSFCGSFFKELAKFLRIKHRTSAALTPRSNGLAENVVQRVNQMVKYYTDSDKDIETVLPLIELSLRSTVHTRIKITPFEVVFGKKMRLAEPGEVTTPLPFTGQPLNYFKWLIEELTELHKQVKIKREEVKEEDKVLYGKTYNVQTPKWSEGDMVLLEDKRIRPGSDSVLTHKPFYGPFYISDVVKGSEDIGTAYRLIDANTGRMHKRLVPSDRLKRYTANRTDFTARLPRLVKDEVKSDTKNDDVVNGDGVKQTDDVPAGFEPALRILKERIRNKQKEYLVLFEDKNSYWCSDVTPALLQNYRLRQARLRKNQRRRLYDRSRKA